MKTRNLLMAVFVLLLAVGFSGCSGSDVNGSQGNFFAGPNDSPGNGDGTNPPQTALQKNFYLSSVVSGVDIEIDSGDCPEVSIPDEAQVPVTVGRKLFSDGSEILLITFTNPADQKLSYFWGEAGDNSDGSIGISLYPTGGTPANNEACETAWTVDDGTLAEGADGVSYNLEIPFNIAVWVKGGDTTCNAAVTVRASLLADTNLFAFTAMQGPGGDDDDGDDEDEDDSGDDTIDPALDPSLVCDNWL